MRRTFDVLYYGPDHLLFAKQTEYWDKTSYYCPHCGELQVWVRAEVRDEYKIHACAACGEFFDVTGIGEGPPTDSDRQTIEHLREP